MFMQMFRAFVCVLSLMFLSSAPAQDFGSLVRGPKVVSVKRLLPATVNLNQKRILIVATSAMTGTEADLPNILKTKLVTMIQRDPRFIVDEKKPETILKFVITNSYIEERHMTVGAGSSAQNCTGFTGKLEVSYQALEVGTNAPLDSENLSHAITMDNRTESGGGLKSLGSVFSHAVVPCGSGGKSTMHEAWDELVDQIVHQMAQRAAPTEEVFIAKLPGKKLEPLSSLAMSQRWGTLEEEAAKMEKLPKPEDDAYRLYLLALAKEAQAYDLAREAAERDQGKRKDISADEADTEFQRAQTYLDDARKLYKDAIEAKPGEKEFREPDARMEQAVTVYGTIARHKEEYEKYLAEKSSRVVAVAVAPPPPIPVSNGAPPVASPRSSRQTAQTTTPKPLAGNGPLQQILKFCQAGVELNNILDYVKDQAFLDDAKAASYKFNIRTDPVSLATSCKEKAGPLQQLMRARLASLAPGAPVKQAAAPPKTPGSAPPTH
jgi:hypothetical protein